MGVMPAPKGELNPAVNQNNIRSTICVAGWSSSVRPSVSYTNTIKKQLMRKYAPKEYLSAYELDHYIPISLGGSPTSPDNLWLQSWDTSKNENAVEKDVLETKLNKDVCKGAISLEAAQKQMYRYK
jgi:hypothetical protein